MLHVYWGLSCGILDNNSLALLMEPDKNKLTQCVIRTRKEKKVIRYIQREK